MGLFGVFLLQSYKWMGWVGLGWDGWDLCVGLLYEHRFAVLIKGTNQVSFAVLQKYKNEHIYLKIKKIKGTNQVSFAVFQKDVIMSEYKGSIYILQYWTAGQIL